MTSKATKEVIPCPLCRLPEAACFRNCSLRRYLQCKRCGLVFVHPDERLNRTEEKARYDLHRNDPADPEYRSFLARLAAPLSSLIQAGSSGLDFGCGPGPALAMMLKEQGHSVTLYDPFYAPDAGAWLQAYDFITATEVLEHLYMPGEELDRLFGVLKPGGFLGIMTKQLPASDELSDWHYMRDPTHVCFFSPATFEYIACAWKAALTIIDSDVVLFQKMK